MYLEEFVQIMFEGTMEIKPEKFNLTWQTNIYSAKKRQESYSTHIHRRETLYINEPAHSLYCSCDAEAIYKKLPPP